MSKIYLSLHKQAQDLQSAGRYAEAHEAWKAVCAKFPDKPDAIYGLGYTLIQLKREEEGEACYRRALEIDAGHVPSLINLTSRIVNRHEYDEVLALCARLPAKHAFEVQALLVEGASHLGLKNYEMALAKLRRANQLSPDNLQVMGRLTSALAQACLFEEAVEVFWRLVELNPRNLNMFIPALFNQHYLPDRSPAESLVYAKEYGRVLTSEITPFEHKHLRAGPQRLKIGIVSGDFNHHPVGFFLENVLKHLDPERVELFAYYLSRREDAVTARLRPHFSTWRNMLGDTPEHAAQRIHNDGIQILMDLSGHTTNSGLPVFAWKPAPVQLTWLGYFASTGLTAIDYILGDRFILPEGEEHHFVETPWRLPHGYLCFQPPQDDVAIGPPPSLSGKPVTFGCFNTIAKMNDAVVDTWARVLHAVPDSRLFLKGRELGNDYHDATTRARFAERGIPAERLILAGQTSRSDYFERLDEVDVILDPFPYNGGTTTVEALWMGLPVVTLRGDRYVGHMGESILNHIGHPEWITDDKDAYVALAQSLAQQVELRAGLRETLRGELLGSSLCDGPGFARQLEAAFEQMWARRCCGTAVDSISADEAAMLAAEFAQTFDVLAERGEVELLIQLAREMTKLLPADVLGWKILGYALNAQGSKEGARDAIGAALQQFPNDPELAAIATELSLA